MRSSLCPRGFTWNSTARRRKADLGNVLGDFSFEAMKRQIAKARPAVMEQPEDLGAVKRPRVPGHQPASMWQFSQHEELARLPGVQTVALAQQDFGTENVKPTRLLLKLPGPLHPKMFEGPPQFDEQGFYMGPLPKMTGPPLIGRQDGQFRTAAAASWPPALCEWVAEQFMTSFRNREAGEVENCEGGERPQKKMRREEKVEEEREEPVDPFNPLVAGGIGPARGCRWKGITVPFHDGGCLPSPGRWDLKKRKYPSGGGWEELRRKVRGRLVSRAGGEAALERECFSMARGEAGCKLVQDEGLLQEVRSDLASFCEEGDSSLEVAEGQPFRLRLMRNLLEKAGDGDFDFLKEAEEGLPLGVTRPLPRTPKAFEKQVEWALVNDPTVECALSKGNYPSARDHEEHLRQHLEEEVKEGLVVKMTEEEFESTYGDERAVAALAVLVEDEEAGKKRVIHDGSHDIRVNHRIRCLDKIRMPGGREKRYLLMKYKESRDVVFSVIGDIGKAHRRFKYDKREHGFLACRVSEEDGFVYVNRVGTFGIASTPYWWSRISGACLRLVHYLTGPSVPLELLLYADDLEALGVTGEGRRGIVMSFVILAALGAPFKWRKQRGGMCTEWIGLTTNYADYSFGLSDRRAKWVIDWIGALCEEKLVDAREFAAALGRLGFAATALPWERPFLGPLYLWSAAIRAQKGKVTVPWAILAILDWIAMRMRAGGHREVVREEMEEGGSELVFYTDARASETSAGIGGYLATSEDLKQCPWFSVEVCEGLAPWIGVKGGNPKRVIAALELLATIIAVKLWGKRARGGMKAKMKAFTDNKGNAFALIRGMSTKYPLTVLLMELSEEMRALDLRMELEWIKREENQDADDLSNGDWRKFSEEMREDVRPETVEWRVLEKVQKRGEELYREVQALKEQKKAAKKAGGAGKASAGAKKVLPKW